MRKWRRDGDVGARHLDQIGIGKVEIVAGHTLGKIIAKAQREVEAVETRRHQHIEIGAPAVAIIEPGLVLGLAEEGPRHAAHAVRRGFFDAVLQMQRDGTAKFHPLGQLMQAIDKTARVHGRNQQGVMAAGFTRHQPEAIRRTPVGRGRRKIRHERRARCRDHNQKSFGLFDIRDDIEGCAMRFQRGGQLLHRQRHRC